MKHTNLGVVRKALANLMSRNPLKYSQRPIEIQAMAATNSKEASGMELALLCALVVLGTKRTWRRMEEESRESSRASLRCERIFLSSMQKSLAVLAEFTSVPVMAKDWADHVPNCRFSWKFTLLFVNFVIRNERQWTPINSHPNASIIKCQYCQSQPGIYNVTSQTTQEKCFHRVSLQIVTLDDLQTRVSSFPAEDSRVIKLRGLDLYDDHGEIYSNAFSNSPQVHLSRRDGCSVVAMGRPFVNFLELLLLVASAPDTRMMAVAS